MENLNHEILIQDIVNATMKIIKQNRIKDMIFSLELLIANDVYMFPPAIILTLADKKLELNFWDLNNKELHYRIDAVSGEVNRDINGSREESMKIYIEIINRLRKHNWNNICKASDDFKISVR